jgi:hypothetical protein
LRRLQGWRLDHAEELGTAGPVDARNPATGASAEKGHETGPVTPAGEAPAAPAQTVFRPEAAAPQVGGGSSSCNADFRGHEVDRRDDPSAIDRELARRGAEGPLEHPSKPPPAGRAYGLPVLSQ